MRKGLMIALIVAIAAIGIGIGAAIVLLSRNGPAGKDITTTAEPEETIVIPGTWATASMGYIRDGELCSDPEYHVQFTDKEVLYGHMIDGAFEVDHADTIRSIETTANGYRVRVETPNGHRYTYETYPEDENVLNYYETWNEDEFSAMYRAGASLWLQTDDET